MKVFLTIAAAFLAKEASAEAHYGLPHLVPSYRYGYSGYGPVVPQVHGGFFGRRSHPVLRPVLPFHPIGKREAEPETDSAFTYTVMAHHPKDQEMTNNRYTLLSRMDSHRRMQQRQRQQQQLMDESNMQQMDRHMQYRIMDQDQMMQQQQQQRMGLNQQQQIVNNMLDNRRDDLDQRRMLQYSMDNNQMMMHRDNVHDMRVMGMQQQQQGLQTNLNRLDMNNQVMRMNNRQQMQQYRLDNDLNQMQRMDMRLDNNMMRMMTKREAEGEADGEAGYGYQTYSETPFHKTFAGAYYTPDISPIHPIPAVPAVHPVPAVPAVFNRGYSMYSAPGVFVGHPHPAMGHPIMPFF